jgi:hypothetical protein
LDAALKLLFYVDDEFLKELINTLRKKHRILLVAGKWTGLEVNAGETE